MNIKSPLIFFMKNNFLYFCIFLYSLCISCNNIQDINNLPEVTTKPTGGCYVSNEILIFKDDKRGYTCNVRWSIKDLPLRLIVHDEKIDKSVRFAADYFNKKLGVAVFVLDNSGGAKIKISSTGRFFLSTKLGETIFRRNEFLIEFAEVKVRNDLPISRLDLVMIHELGHVLGLQHDRYGCSIMKSELESFCSELSDENVRALKIIYTPMSVNVTR